MTGGTMIRAGLIFAAAASAVCGEPRLWFSKSFPGSTPAYVEISLEPNGAAQYKEAPDDPLPIKMQLDEADCKAMFDLADKLDRFKRPLESPLKVAKMGMKTFRFEDGASKTETQFNFSEDLDARALLEWFERLSETGQLYINLEKSVKYDKLGVNRAILLMESSLERKRLVSAATFLPLLDRVAKNDSYMNMARTRAAAIADVIRAAK